MKNTNKGKSWLVEYTARVNDSEHVQQVRCATPQDADAHARKVRGNTKITIRMQTRSFGVGVGGKQVAWWSDIAHYPIRNDESCCHAVYTFGTGAWQGVVVCGQ